VLKLGKDCGLPSETRGKEDGLGRFYIDGLSAISIVSCVIAYDPINRVINNCPNYNRAISFRDLAPIRFSPVWNPYRKVQTLFAWHHRRQIKPRSVTFNNVFTWPTNSSLVGPYGHLVAGLVSRIYNGEGHIAKNFLDPSRTHSDIWHVSFELPVRDPREQAGKYNYQEIPQFLRVLWPEPMYKAFYCGAFVLAMFILWCGVLLAGRDGNPLGGLVILVAWALTGCGKTRKTLD
jgi:hypothetical protein